MTTLTGDSGMQMWRQHSGRPVPIGISDDAVHEVEVHQAEA